jgi:CHAD domain-containing protein
LRIRLKRLQYAGEVAAIRDERAVTVARRAERLQTRLGSSHDHAVAAEWVQRQMVIVPRLRSGLAELAYGQRVLEADTATEWRRDLDRLGREVARTRRAV